MADSGKKWLRGIPVENGPFEANTFSVDGQLRQLHEERFAVPMTAIFQLHEKVFEIDSRLASECRIVVEEECEADHDPSFIRKQALRIRSCTKEMRGQIVGLGHRIAFEFLIDGERMDQF